MLVGVQLLAQALDVGINRAIIAHMLIAPHQREQVVAGEHTSGRRRQRIEQLGFLAREIQLVSVQRDAQRGQVDRQAADDQRLARSALGQAADGGADAGITSPGEKGLTI